MMRRLFAYLCVYLLILSCTPPKASLQTKESKGEPAQSNTKTSFQVTDPFADAIYLASIDEVGTSLESLSEAQASADSHFSDGLACHQRICAASGGTAYDIQDSAYESETDIPGLISVHKLGTFYCRASGSTPLPTNLQEPEPSSSPETSSTQVPTPI